MSSSSSSSTSSSSTSSSSSSSSSSNTSPPTTTVKRACDACHRRKVKCDGVQPCRNCTSVQLCCTYHAIPQKKGPKGSRAKVISELRETQRQTTLSSTVAYRLNGILSPSMSPALAPTPGLLTPAMVKDCVDFFFSNVYPSMPILHRQRFEAMIPYVEQSIETYCLLSSLCAFMMVQPNMPVPGSSVTDPFGLDAMPGANLMTGQVLLEESVRVRKAFDHLESPNMQTLVTNYFLFGCYFAMELHTKAWFYLREASTLAHIMMMHQEDSYLNFDIIESSQRKRLYWLLFNAERAYALQRSRPLTLPNNISPPTVNDDPTETFPQSLLPHVNLCVLFRPFDETFLSLWRSALTSFSSEWISMLQKQLSERLPSYLDSTRSQDQDLRNSQQWLETMVWQLGLHKGHLGHSPEEASMTFGYPIEIARGMMEMTSQFSHQSIEGMAVRLLETLYSICATLLTILIQLPPSPDPFTLSPRDQLPSFLAVLSFIRAGDHRFLPLLLCKVNEVLPALASPMMRINNNDVAEQDFKPQINGMNNHFDVFGTNNAVINTSSMRHGGMDYDSKPAMCGRKYQAAHIDHNTSNMKPKRMDELSNPPTMLGESSDYKRRSPHHQQHGFTNSSASPPIIPLSMDFSGMSNSMGVNASTYDGFSDRFSTGSSISSGQMSNMGGMNLCELKTPIRQNSGSSWSSQSISGCGEFPRSIPGYEMPY